jgi:phage gp29-like protein
MRSILILACTSLTACAWLSSHPSSPVDAAKAAICIYEAAARGETIAQIVVTCGVEEEKIVIDVLTTGDKAAAKRMAAKGVVCAPASSSSH